MELLNESPGTFLNVFKSILLHEIQLSLSKFSDPERLGKRENMSLEAYHEVLKDLGEVSSADKMKEPMQQFAKVCE